MPCPTETPLSPSLGVKLDGISVTTDLDDATFAILRDALDRHSLVLLRDQVIEPAQLGAFAKRFGPIQLSTNQRYCAPDASEVMLVGNLYVDGELRSMFSSGEEEWHFDQIYKTNPNATPFNADQYQRLLYRVIVGAFESSTKRETTHGTF